ncbi:hypothetical protein [Muricoccus vinaceus]|uniref:Uncharacterized protein n=1 Tax=Muricoccus vinaceus TaxID=424704 RepID=A0ABV6IUK5_9PROT
MPARIVLPGQAVTPLGIQGVRPMAAEERALAAREAEIDTLLAARSEALPGPEAAALVRAFHCGWQRRQGVIAAAVLHGHRAFAGWLGCA